MVKRTTVWAVWIYLVLLIVSHLVAVLSPDVASPDGFVWQQVPEFRADGSTTGAEVELAYQDRLPKSGAAAPVVLLLHGSPIATSFIEPLLKEIEKTNKFHLIAPELPGLGASSNAVIDYSVAAHAHYVIALLDALGIDRVHVVGYSMGGGVALEMVNARPDLVASLAMVSSIGVQAYELFGQYEINHSVHWLQWLVLEAIDWGVPHFGWFDRQPLSIGYARNFLDTDQRPLRGILKTYACPLLIQHGKNDRFVPIQAAREHARIVPQSELIEYDGGHEMVAFAPDVLLPDLVDFIDRAESGLARDRASAEPSRVTAAAAPFRRDRSWQYTGIAAIVVTLLLMAATLVSEDLTCIGAGFLAANGLISLPLAIVACFMGIFIGDLMLYAAGRMLGRAALRCRPMRWLVSESAERRAEAWFRRRGAIIILISRFLPGTRTATYFTAGVVRAPFLKFLLFFGVAAALWTPLLVTFSSHLGERIVPWYESYEMFALPGLIAGGLFLYALIEYGIPLFSWRGRRLLLGKWRRLSRWEYWPLWVVNAPVAFYVLYLGFFRYRRPTAFTLSNPGIPHGGFLGESKSAILLAFPPEADYMLPWVLLSTSESLDRRRARFHAFQSALSRPWPIVIKPDEGQRGLGVHIVRSTSEAEALFAQTHIAWIVQAYAPGKEYGVFYYRTPKEGVGRIPSITIKVMTAVVGDGRRTIEELILADDRTVDQALRFLEKFSDRLEEVPAEGERVPLVELGTHARGSTFLDGCDLLTPALLERVDAIARDFEGFNYGRFDFRVPSVEALQEGREIKLLEVNGLTSEQTHIYAPGASLLAAWRTLMSSWHLAIRIGLQHEAINGLKPWPTLKFLRWWWQSHWRQRQIK